MPFASLNAVLAGAMLVAAVRAAGALRLFSLMRAYAASALFLAGLVAGLGVVRHQPELYWLAAVSVALKVFLIPRLILGMAARAGMSMRLSSRFRPASTYLAILALIAVAATVALRSPFAAGADPAYLLAAAPAVSVVGFAMMILRRDLLSQIVGFLVLENGVAAFSVAVTRDFPFLVELSFLALLTVGTVLMGILSRRVRELYGTESTQSLRELVD